jgi:hypothetical protein
MEQYTRKSEKSTQSPAVISERARKAEKHLNRTKLKPFIFQFRRTDMLYM